MNTKAKQKIYLDVSIPNHLFADDRPEWMEATQRLWVKCKAGEFEIFVSDIFFEELERCPEPKLGKMYEQLRLIEFERIKKSDEIKELATEYANNGILRNKLNDRLHIASAVAKGCQAILSWNFGDIVKQSTRDGVKVVNAISRYKEIWIVSPDAFLMGGHQ